MIRPLIIADETNALEFLSKDTVKVDLNFLLKGNLGAVMNSLNQLYDIVYVDNNNGFDDIFRNARLFEEALARINAKRDPLHDKSYVVGLGMGGLVARYALRDMEIKGLNHDVCKFISLNAPHKGVNIPIGLQALIRYIQNIRIAKIFIKEIVRKADSIANVLDSKLIKQMLIYTIDKEYEYSNEHAAFMQEYERIGMPMQCENVAISNGSRRGDYLEIPGSLLFQKSDSWFGFKSDIYLLKQKQEFQFFSGSIKAFLIK